MNPSALDTGQTTTNPNKADVSQSRENDLIYRCLSQPIRSLANKHRSPDAFFRGVFSMIVEHYRPIAAVIDLRIGASGVSAHHLAKDKSGAQYLDTARLEEMLVDCRADDSIVVRRLQENHAHPTTLTSIPIPDPHADVPRGLLIVAWNQSETVELNATILELANVLALAAAYEPRPKSSRPAEAANNPTLTAIGRAGAYGSTKELAYTLVNSVAQRFGCEQVGVGVCRDEKTNVVAISGIANFKHNSPGVVEMRQAMDECLDHSETLVGQEEGNDPQQQEMAIHRQWAKSTRSSICSVPLRVEDEVVAVISLRRSKREPFTAKLVKELEATVTPFGAAFLMMQRADRSLRQHLSDTTKTKLDGIRNPKSAASRYVQIAVAVAAIVFLFGFLPYRPTTGATTLPASMTHVQAPFDMLLSEVHVNSGDVVQEGQLLATFDTRDLELEKATLEAEWRRSQIEVREAMTRSDVAAAALAKASSGVVLTQLKAVDSKLARCEVRAPEDGMIVSCELKKKIGQMFPQGDPLLTFAPMEEWEVTLEIPEYLATQVRVGQVGYFSSFARPDDRIRYRITQVAGSAEVIDGKNQLRTVAELEETRPWMRMGMEGSARTQTGWKPVWWIALHRLIESAYFNFWI